MRIKEVLPIVIIDGGFIFTIQECQKLVKILFEYELKEIAKLKAVIDKLKHSKLR